MLPLLTYPPHIDHHLTYHHPLHHHSASSGDLINLPHQLDPYFSHQLTTKSNSTSSISGNSLNSYQPSQQQHHPQHHQRSYSAGGLGQVNLGHPTHHSHHSSPYLPSTQELPTASRVNDLFSFPGSHSSQTEQGLHGQHGHGHGHGHSHSASNIIHASPSGMELGGMPQQTPPLYSLDASLPPSLSNAYNPYPLHLAHTPQHQQQQQHQQHQPQHQHQHQYHSNANSVPSSPMGSRRPSFSESAPYTAHSYGSSTSSLASGLAILDSNKPSFDSSTSSSPAGTFIPHHHVSHSSLLSPVPAPYPLATSASGIITVYSAHPSSGTTNCPVSVSIGIMPHEPHFIRGFRVMFGSHGTTTRVVGEKRLHDGERVELIASTPPIQLTAQFAQTSSTVTLLLQALDEHGHVADWVDIGTFSYIGTFRHTHISYLFQTCLQD